MKRWLTEELDRKPYKCDLDKLKKIFDEIAEAKTKVERYFEVHPKAKKAIITDEKRKKRFRDSALSYLALESGDEIDIVPSKDKTEFEIELMRQSGKILAETLNLLEKQVRAGISTHELDKIAFDYIIPVLL